MSSNQITTTIIIEVKKESYDFLNKTLDSHINFIRKIGMNDLLKKSLLEDLYKIKSIVQSNTKKPKGVHNGRPASSSNGARHGTASSKASPLQPHNLGGSDRHVSAGPSGNNGHHRPEHAHAPERGPDRH